MIERGCIATKIGKLGLKFNICIDNVFEKIKLASNEAIDISMVVGLGRWITQLNVLSLSKKRFMLNMKKCQITSHQGINFCFKYYCTWNFNIHGAQDLKRFNDIDFSLHKDEFGPFLRWCFFKFGFLLLVLRNVSCFCHLLWKFVKKKLHHKCNQNVQNDDFTLAYNW